jgi:hypothetical protein
MNKPKLGRPPVLYLKEANLEDMGNGTTAIYERIERKNCDG